MVYEILRDEIIDMKIDKGRKIDEVKMEERLGM